MNLSPQLIGVLIILLIMLSILVYNFCRSYIFKKNKIKNKEK